jgi:hypothetical protein
MEVGVVRRVTALVVSLTFALSGMLTVAAQASTVVAELGVYPVLGSSHNIKELQKRATDNETLLQTAGAKIGLTDDEYAKFRHSISESRAVWVVVPRHLDAMTWSSAGHAYALKDVIIPANTHGWEVDIPEDRQIVKLYLPARCGNLSVVRAPRPVVAHKKVRRPVVAVAPPPTPAPTPTPVPEVIETPPPALPPPPPQKPKGHFAFLPIIVGGALLLVHGSGGHITGNPLPPPAVPAILPPPNNCP